MIRCRWCGRKYTKDGLQEQLSLLAIHVRTRHRQAMQAPPEKWYKETPMEGNEEPKVEPRDAGDHATEIKWKHAAQGAVVVIVDQNGQAHIGASGINPENLRRLYCVMIQQTFVVEQQAARPSVPLIGV